MKQTYKYNSAIDVVNAYWARQKRMRAWSISAIRQYNISILLRVLRHEIVDNNNDDNGEEIVPCIGQNMDDTRGSAPTVFDISINQAMDFTPKYQSYNSISYFWLYPK